MMIRTRGGTGPCLVWLRAGDTTGELSFNRSTPPLSRIPAAAASGAPVVEAR